MFFEIVGLLTEFMLGMFTLNASEVSKNFFGIFFTFIFLSEINLGILGSLEL